MLTAEGIDINTSLAHTKVMFYEVVPVEIDSTAETCFFRKVTGGFFCFFFGCQEQTRKDLANDFGSAAEGLALRLRTTTHTCSVRNVFLLEG
jgi:hypothetical protein